MGMWKLFFPNPHEFIGVIHLDLKSCIEGRNQRSEVKEGSNKKQIIDKHSGQATRIETIQNSEQVISSTYMQKVLVIDVDSKFG